MLKINADVLDNAARLHALYAKAAPYPHVVIDGFLDESSFERLLDAAISLEFTHKESDLYAFAQSPPLDAIDESTMQELTTLLTDSQTTSLIETITGESLSGAVADLFAAVYQDTDYLLCHDDLLEDRKVALILYLEEPEDGGELQLLDEQDGHPRDVVATVKPRANRAVLFGVNEHSWHSVAEVIGGYRVSIGGWFRG